MPEADVSCYSRTMEIVVAPLTGRQSEVLTFIKSFVAKRGFPPTRAEIARGFGWRSANAAEEHLQALERKGAIDLTRGVSRGIRVCNAIA